MDEAIPPLGLATHGQFDPRGHSPPPPSISANLNNDDNPTDGTAPPKLSLPGGSTQQQQGGSVPLHHANHQPPPPEYIQYSSAIGSSPPSPPPVPHSLPQSPYHFQQGPPPLPPVGVSGASNGLPTAISDPVSLPWTVGSTDGSFASMVLMQQQQRQEQPVPAQNAIIHDNTGSNAHRSDANAGTASPTMGGAESVTTPGAPIGEAGEANNGNYHSSTSVTNLAALAAVQSGKSLYHDQLFHQSSSSVESVLTASCDVMGFDIAEMWLRTGPKTHQLTNSHLRPTALEDSVRKDLVEVYYGEKSNERTHRLSPALCKRAKDANDVVWVTAHTPHGAEALRMSISNVRTAVAVPVCHEASNTNMTIIYFSIRRVTMRPPAVEFLVHMSLCAAVASVNSLSQDGLIDRCGVPVVQGEPFGGAPSSGGSPARYISQSAHVRRTDGKSAPAIRHQRADHTSITGARLDLQWRQLQNVEYLTDGGNSWIHTAVFNGRPVVVKTLKPECQDVALAINEIEAELDVHSRLNHPNVVELIGAGLTSKGVRFIVLERLDGGTLTQMLGYDTRIRDRRRRFWRKKQLAYLDVLGCARSLASALQYCHEQAIPGSIVLHRDLKPDNIGFKLDGTVELLDFGLARILENADPMSNEVYAMSGETGSLRYMAPEVAEGLPYNHKADVYSFGVILWELNAGKKPFIGLSREAFYERVVHGGERPALNKKWPSELCKLISDCWNVDIGSRPSFGNVIERIDRLLSKEKEGWKSNITLKKISGMIDRHSTWF